MKQAMTPEEIKEKKPYLDWSLSEHEYDYICDHLLHRLPLTILKSVCSPQCGVNTVLTRNPSQY